MIGALIALACAQANEATVYSMVFYNDAQCTDLSNKDANVISFPIAVDYDSSNENDFEFYYFHEVYNASSNQ